MPKKTTIIRRAKGKENPYAQISRESLQDKKLTWQETGMLAYLLSLPITWEINLQDLINRKVNGKQSTRTVLNGLIKKGYIQKTIKKNEKGQFVHHEYVVYEKSISPLPNFREMDTRDDTKKDVNFQNQEDEVVRQEVEKAGYAYTATDHSIMSRKKKVSHG